MLKSDFVSKISERTNLPKTDALAAVDAFTDIIVEAIKNGDTVPLKGFGTFYAASRKEREGRNPRTGEPVTIPASVSLSFRASKIAKDAVNGK